MSNKPQRHEEEGRSEEGKALLVRVREFVAYCARERCSTFTVPAVGIIFANVEPAVLAKYITSRTQSHVFKARSIAELDRLPEKGRSRISSFAPPLCGNYVAMYELPSASTTTAPIIGIYLGHSGQILVRWQSHEKDAQQGQSQHYKNARQSVRHEALLVSLVDEDRVLEQVERLFTESRKQAGCAELAQLLALGARALNEVVRRLDEVVFMHYYRSCTYAPAHDSAFAAWCDLGCSAIVALNTAKEMNFAAAPEKARQKDLGRGLRAPAFSLLGALTMGRHYTVSYVKTAVPHHALLRINVGPYDDVMVNIPRSVERLVCAAGDAGVQPSRGRLQLLPVPAGAVVNAADATVRAFCERWCLRLITSQGSATIDWSTRPMSGNWARIFRKLAAQEIGAPPVAAHPARVSTGDERLDSLLEGFLRGTAASKHYNDGDAECFVKSNRYCLTIPNDLPGGNATHIARWKADLAGGCFLVARQLRGEQRPVRDDEWVSTGMSLARREFLGHIAAYAGATSAPPLEVPFGALSYAEQAAALASADGVAVVAANQVKFKSTTVTVPVRVRGPQMRVRVDLGATHQQDQVFVRGAAEAAWRETSFSPGLFKFTAGPLAPGTQTEARSTRKRRHDEFRK